MIFGPIVIPASIIGGFASALPLSLSVALVLGRGRGAIRDVVPEVVRDDDARDIGHLEPSRHVEENNESPGDEGVKPDDVEDDGPQAAQVVELVTEPAAQLPPSVLAESAHVLVPATESAFVCEVAYWRGYRYATFYARVYKDGEELAVAESPSFRPHGKGEPVRTPEAAAAWDALCSHLQSDGWEQIGSGKNWYDAAFLSTPHGP